MTRHLASCVFSSVSPPLPRQHPLQTLFVFTFKLIRHGEDPSQSLITSVVKDRRTDKRKEREEREPNKRIISTSESPELKRYFFSGAPCCEVRLPYLAWLLNSYGSCKCVTVIFKTKNFSRKFLSNFCVMVAMMVSRIRLEYISGFFSIC